MTSSWMQSGYWAWLAHGSTAVVLLGVIGESLAEFRRWRSRSLKRKVSRVSAYVLIAGIAGELAGGLVLRRQELSVQASLDEKAQTAKMKAQQATARAAELGLDLNHLESFVDREKKAVAASMRELTAAELSLAGATASARTHAEELGREQEALEEAAGPRILNETALTAALRTAGPSSIELSAAAGDEPANLLGYIAFSLRGAGWKVSPTGRIRPRNKDGVLIEFAPASRPKASALCLGLKVQKIVVLMRERAADSRSTSIEMWIGPKPDTYFLRKYVERNLGPMAPEGGIEGCS